MKYHLERTSEPLLLSTAPEISRSVLVKHTRRINLGFHLPFINVLAQTYVPCCLFYCLFASYVFLNKHILQIPGFSDLSIVINSPLAHTVLDEK